ncbi:MAG TPA: tyrosine-type recombinase/integrase [Humibacter sp.]|nr:tyrosine-type recombinase/integrase [Humibacter sp.]
MAKLYVDLEQTGGIDGGPLSANTVNKTHVVLGAMLDAAVDDGIIAANPARKSRVVKAPSGKVIRESAPEITTWSADQLRFFLDWDRDEYHDDMFALWLTIAHTGMRRSEALALRWADVDLKQQRVSVRRALDTVVARTTKRTKTGNARAIDIDDDTTAVLRAWRSLRGAIAFDFARADAYVFGNLQGDLVRPNSITAKWDIRLKAAQRALGTDSIPHMTIHGLRHTHATLLLELGVHPKVVQERLGHSNISTTLNIYSHVTPTMQRDAVTRLASLLH